MKMKKYKHWPYLVSCCGKVVNQRTAKQLNPYLSGRKGSEYLQVQLCLSGKSKRVYVHQMVAELYVSKPEGSERHQVNHIDGDRFNNSAANLEWVTIQENLEHAAINGLRNLPASHSIQASDDGFGYVFPTIRSAEHFGFDSSAVCKVLNGSRNKCKGFKFESLAKVGG